MIPMLSKIKKILFLINNQTFWPSKNKLYIYIRNKFFHYKHKEKQHSFYQNSIGKMSKSKRKKKLTPKEDQHGNNSPITYPKMTAAQE